MSNYNGSADKLSLARAVEHALIKAESSNDKDFAEAIMRMLREGAAKAERVLANISANKR